MSDRPLVAFGALGGTISMTPDAASGGIVPTLTADDLVSSVADELGLDAVSETIQRVGSPSITAADLRKAFDWASAQLDGGARGAVISQGTDTLEETSWFLDLVWNRAEPLVMIGAMRGPTAPGSDGAGNVAGALVVATSPGARDRGVMVTLADVVHAARWVRKEHTSVVNAFNSPIPLGLVAEQRAHWLVPPSRTAPLPFPDLGDNEPWAALIPSHLGDDGRLVEAAVEAGAAGLVVAGSGVGHVSEKQADRLEAAARTLPVILTSRTMAGPVHERTYGFVGAEVDLLRRGLIPAGWLNPLKARILLWLLLGLGYDRDQIAAEFATRGQLPG